MVQEALHYLREEVSAEAQTAGMYNSILEAALYERDSQIAYEALELMQDAAVAPDSRTAAAALRIMVGCMTAHIGPLLPIRG